MKQYNFDEIVERKGSSCVKHDALRKFYGRDDLLPMWVADMDFRSPDFVMEAIRKRCQHEVLGYATPSDSYFEAMQQWLQKHYSVEAQRDDLHYIPGIVAGIAFVLQTFTHPGDSVLVLTPVYPPFLNLPENNGRQLVCSPLQLVNGRFEIDFDDLEERAQTCKLMILSNPHNPGGRVWTLEELRRIADICYRNNLVVIADEIHADLTLPGFVHTSFSTVSPQARECSITFIAPSKTFNIAGLSSSLSYIPSPILRERFHHFLDSYEVANGNIFAFVGAEAAFRYGEEWLLQLKDYLKENVAFLDHYLKHDLPQIKAVLPEASFLPWLDFSGFGYSHQECLDRLLNRAHVALNDGTTFGGKDYENFFRINIGCPRQTLAEALNRIKEAFVE